MGIRQGTAVGYMMDVSVIRCSLCFCSKKKLFKEESDISGSFLFFIYALLWTLPLISWDVSVLGFQTDALQVLWNVICHSFSYPHHWSSLHSMTNGVGALGKCIS